MKTPLVKYEKDFVEICTSLRLRLKKDEDKTPILMPRGKKKKKIYHVCAWGVDKFALVLTAPHGRTKNKWIEKVRSVANFDIAMDGDCECVIVFNMSDLKKVAKKLGLEKGVDKNLLAKTPPL